MNRLKEIEEYPEETGEKEIHTNGYDITFDHVRFSYEKDKPVSLLVLLMINIWR